MRKLLIATRNPGKFREIMSIIKDVPFKLVSLAEVENITDKEVEETADNLADNAILKAKTYGQESGLLTLADDTGLEVDALGGRPGVYSSRYAPGTDEDRYRKLLSELENIPDEKRTARFRAVVAIFDPGSGKLKTCEGVFEGKIAREPKGDNGFGYDPIFYYPPLGKTTAQMTDEEKNKVSHRAKSLAKAKEILENDF